MKSLGILGLVLVFSSLPVSAHAQHSCDNPNGQACYMTATSYCAGEPIGQCENSRCGSGTSCDPCSCATCDTCGSDPAVQCECNDGTLVYFDDCAGTWAKCDPCLSARALPSDRGRRASALGRPNACGVDSRKPAAVGTSRGSGEDIVRVRKGVGDGSRANGKEDLPSHGVSRRDKLFDRRGRTSGGSRP